MRETAERLLIAAGILLLISGALFGVMGQWLLAALLWSGAFGVAVAAMNFSRQ